MSLVTHEPDADLIRMQNEIVPLPLFGRRENPLYRLVGALLALPALTFQATDTLLMPFAPHGLKNTAFVRHSTQLRMMFSKPKMKKANSAFFQPVHF